MNKLLAALIAGTFAFGSVAAMAQVPPSDKTPPQPVDQAKLKADAQKAKADAAALTPEEKAAAKKAKAAKKEKELATQQGKSTPLPPASPEDTAAVKAQKAQPKALPTKAAHQDALEKQEKAPGAGGGN